MKHTYTLKAESLSSVGSDFHVEVTAEEIIYALEREAEVKLPSTPTLFGQSFGVIAALLGELYKRGGAHQATPADVRTAFGPASSAWPDGAHSVLHCPSCWGEFGYRAADLNARHSEGLICPHCKRAHYIADVVRAYEQKLRDLRAGAACTPSIAINVPGNVIGDERLVLRIVEELRNICKHNNVDIKWVGSVGHATLTNRQAWQPRTYQRRQRPALFCGPDKRSSWLGGRRATDVHRDRRVSFSKKFPRRSSEVHPLFWLHHCIFRSGYTELRQLRTQHCPDCGMGRTTANDRRTGATERRAA